MIAEECHLSSVRYYYLYVPQPDYDADMDVEITENILDAAKTVCFSFPSTLTKEQLLENSIFKSINDLLASFIRLLQMVTSFILDLICQVSIPGLYILKN